MDHRDAGDLKKLTSGSEPGRVQGVGYIYTFGHCRGQDREGGRYSVLPSLMNEISQHFV